MPHVPVSLQQFRPAASLFSLKMRTVARASAALHTGSSSVKNPARSDGRLDLLYYAKSSDFEEERLQVQKTSVSFAVKT